jgi:predicted DNA-binding transcriptional regulator AlpA
MKNTIQINDGDRLLNTKQAANFCGYKSTVSFLRAVRNYGFPCIRLNARRVMFDRVQLGEWLQRRTGGGK